MKSLHTKLYDVVQGTSSRYNSYISIQRLVSIMVLEFNVVDLVC